MPRHRTAEDEFFALLARIGRPLEREEIAEQLRWTKQRVAAVIREIDSTRLVVTEGPARGGPGPRPWLYSLPGMEPAKPDPKAPHFDPDTIVVTPSGREARVLVMKPDGFVEIEYLQVRIGHEPRAILKAKLLRAFQAGRERPDPVRIACPEPSSA
jgi:hypothetical protein